MSSTLWNSKLLLPVRFVTAVAQLFYRYGIWPALILIKKLVELFIMVSVFTYASTVAFVGDRIRWVWNYESSQTRDELGGKVAEYMDDPWKRIPFALGSLVLGTPLTLLVVPLTVFLCLAIPYVAIDQMVYPDNDLPAHLQMTPENIALVDKMSDAEKSQFVLNAITGQLEEELNTFPYWVPNDMAGWSPLLLPGVSDNRASRQMGVQYETQVLVAAWGQYTSKYGMNDAPSQDLIDAATKSFNQHPTAWLFPDAESKYRNGLDQVDAYIQKALAGQATVNVTKANLVSFLQVMQDPGISTPAGKVNQRTKNISFFEADNDLYFAAGSATVIRDTLAAFRLVYHKDLAITNATQNLDEGISSLNSLASFNPWMVVAGEHDSMFPSHPGKASTYLNDAYTRLDDIIRALNGKS